MPICSPAQYLYQFPTSGLRSNSRLKFFVVAGAISCASDALKFCESFCGSGHPGRLIALAAIGRRSQPGRVGFNQNAVQGQPRGHIAQRLRLGIGQIAGKGDEETQVE